MYSQNVLAVVPSWLLMLPDNDCIEERLRGLCAKAASASDADLGSILVELKSLINERMSRARSLAAAVMTKTSG